MLTDTAVILAGGKSTRMGFDKQQLKIGNKIIAEYIADKLSNDFSQIIVVSNKPHLYENTGLFVVEDEIKGYGPLAGLYTGLTYSKSKFIYLIACDMPNISLEFIRYMKGLVRNNTDKKAFVLRHDDNKVELFNSFYSVKAMEEVEQLFSLKIQRFQTLLKWLPTHYISESEARKFSPDLSIFKNLNTRSDLEKWQISIE
jgi:molybdopterin-guanine dinucleotide biosynthesis protein A